MKKTSLVIFIITLLVFLGVNVFFISNLFYSYIIRDNIAFATVLVIYILIGTIVNASIVVLNIIGLILANIKKEEKLLYGKKNIALIAIPPLLEGLTILIFNMIIK